MPAFTEPETEPVRDTHYYRFMNGMWILKNDVTIDWATDVFKHSVRSDHIRSVIATKKITRRGEILNNPTITVKLDSPNEGIIGFEAVHHTSEEDELPRFKLNKSENAPFDVSEQKDRSIVSSGPIGAEYLTDEFGVTFKSSESGKFLTKLGFESLGYVRDKRTRQDKHVPFMTAKLQISVREKFFGLGERFTPLVLNGQAVEMWNRNCGTASEQLYKSIPFYLSNRGYGVFVDHSSNVNFDVQSECTTRINIVVPGEKIRFYIIYGPSPKDILQRYTALTGRPAIPPAWTFGLWLSTSFTTSYDYETVSSFLSGMKERDIPVRTFHFDCFWMKGYQWCDFEFDEEYFPDAPRFLKTLKEKYNVNICVWLNTYIAQESALFAEGKKEGYFIKTKDGKVWQTDDWQAGMGIVDFTNPGAWKWFQSKLKTLIDIGVDCFKTDFGERIPCRDVTFYDGSDPLAMHNYYSFLYNKCVFEVLQKEKGHKEACLFARSATTGGQQFPVHWGGDCYSTFEAMAETLRGGLSLTASGFGFWSHDIGGFEGNPDPAVYKRWAVFGLLSSHSRLHGSMSYRVPWNFDEEASVVVQKFSKLKCTLMPYLYANAVEANRSGTPLMRATYFEFPEQIEAWAADTQYMLGPNLLVAPVFEGSSGEVTYYVPNGKWYGLLDGQQRDGPKYTTEVHDFMSVPLLIRSNSILVTGANDSQPDYNYANDFTVNIYDIHSKLSAEIPDYKDPGKMVGSVTAIPNGNGTITVESNIKNGKWNVKILGEEIGAVEGGTLSTVGDELGNKVISVARSTVTITFAK